MLDRTAIKEGHEYLLNGEIVVVYMIHKPGNGESVTLCHRLPPGCANRYPYFRIGTMQMRKFQKQAKILEMCDD